MDMEVFFPGNKRVYARYKGFVIETDQSVKGGGDGSAPAPFDLFMVSIGTCAGIYLLSFLEQRGFSTDDAGLVMRQEHDPETKLVSKVSLELKVPADFPEKYRDAVVRSAQLCAVKKHMEKPPEFSVITTLGSE